MVVGFVTLVAAGGFSGSAAAQSRQYIGAIAYSTSTGDYGYSFRFRNSNEAGQRALKECRARSSASDCEVLKTFGGLYAALTVVRLDATDMQDKPTVLRLPYVGTSAGRDDAEAAGVEECKQNNLKPEWKDLCKVVVVVCSDQRR